MERVDNSGPAFPVWSRDVHGNMIAVNYGMSLRDYFAGRVLSNPLIEYMKESEDVAKACYKLADAMLAERNKQ